jgi:hypothetical protein
MGFVIQFLVDRRASRRQVEEVDQEESTLFRLNRYRRAG